MFPGAAVQNERLKKKKKKGLIEWNRNDTVSQLWEQNTLGSVGSHCSSWLRDPSLALPGLS